MEPDLDGIAGFFGFTGLQMHITKRVPGRIGRCVGAGGLYECVCPLGKKLIMPLRTELGNPGVAKLPRFRASGAGGLPSRVVADGMLETDVDGRILSPRGGCCDILHRVSSTRVGEARIEPELDRITGFLGFTGLQMDITKMVSAAKEALENLLPGGSEGAAV